MIIEMKYAKHNAMKWTSFLYILVSATAAVAQSFEGVIDFETYTKATEDHASVKWFLKDGSSRLEIKGNAGSVPYEATFLFPASDTQLYMLTKMGDEDAVFPVDQSSVSREMLANPIISRTGDRKTIAGYNCYLLNISSAEGLTECWVSDEMKIGIDNLPPSIRAKGVYSALSAKGYSGIPLGIASKDLSGAVNYSFEIKSIFSKSFDTKLFEVPAGYKSGEELIKKSIKVSESR